jgi:hypothetical protein
VPHLKLASHATRQLSRKPSLRASPHKDVLASKIMSANSCGLRKWNSDSVSQRQ